MVCLDSAALNSSALLAFEPQPLHRNFSREAGSCFAALADGSQPLHDVRCPRCERPFRSKSAVRLLWSFIAAEFCPKATPLLRRRLPSHES
jgi:hypothetical protein